MRAKLSSEFVGTVFLLIIVVGSGIMGESISAGNNGIALLINSIATGAGLYVLINLFGPISGAHFNPIVSVHQFFSKKLSGVELFYFICIQTLAAMCGVFLTHLIFNQEIIQHSVKNRTGNHLFFSEIVATFGLLMTIELLQKKSAEKIPMSVALYITSAYFFTSSTSFANPAVTLARSFTNTFSGIDLSCVPLFILAQAIALILIFISKNLFEIR